MQTSQLPLTHAMSPAQFFQAHAKSYLDMLAEIAEAPRVEGLQDLGYCTIDHQTLNITDREGAVKAFPSIHEMYVYLLKEFFQC